MKEARPGAEGEDRTVDAFIEISKGSRSKYELDEPTGRLRLDRVLHSSVHYPTDYGFIPQTLAPDGDHLDVLLVVEEPALPGSLQEVRPIGLLDMSDQNREDMKVLAVPTGDPRFAEIHRLRDLPKHWLREIETFFQTYKHLEAEKSTIVRGWRDVDEAWKAIDSAQAAYRKSNVHRAM
jgi:inorganic pyrophosphatase